MSALVWVLTQIGPGRRGWAIIAFLMEVPLTVVGLLVYAMEAAYQPGTPQHPGTDGPFADGANGTLALTGGAYASGGLLVIAALLPELLGTVLRFVRRTFRGGGALADHERDQDRCDGSAVAFRHTSSTGGSRRLHTTSGHSAHRVLPLSRSRTGTPAARLRSALTKLVRSMPYDLAADRVLPLLESFDPRRSDDARAAWDWLTASGDAPDVKLRDLEYFLWYQLPAKFLTSEEYHRAVALALAELFSHLGYEDGAAVCRAPVTMHVLAEWERDRSSGYRALNRALDESGVEPPDTDVLAWGSVMTVVEASVFDMAAGVLEDAMRDGAFTPGTRGWKQAQAAVVRRFLTTPLHSLHGRTPLAAVHEERARLWAEPPGRPLRQAFLRDVREQVRSVPAAPPAVADHMRPLVKILEIAAAGPALTQVGYLPPGTVRELVTEFGWWDWPGSPRSEADVHQIQTLTEFAKTAALVRRTRTSLRLTAAGRRALSEPAILWEQTVRALAAGDGFIAAIRELLLVRLLRGASEFDEVEREVVPVLAEQGWRPSSGAELTRDMVSFESWEAIGPMNLLGIVDAGKWPDRHLRLTDFGTSAARAILWHRATGPQRSIA